MSEPTTREKYDKAHARYLKMVEHIASHLETMAEDVRCRGVNYGSHLFDQPKHMHAAETVVQSAVELHNLHLGDLVRYAALADRLWRPAYDQPEPEPVPHPEGRAGLVRPERHDYRAPDADGAPCCHLPENHLVHHWPPRPLERHEYTPADINKGWDLPCCDMPKEDDIHVTMPLGDVHDHNATLEGHE